MSPVTVPQEQLNNNESRLAQVSIANSGKGLKLEFIVIGTGISGLACAYSLQKAGHSVHVLEAESSIPKVSVNPIKYGHFIH